jgi:L-galactose dehydrogenase/L-glyceraldehyde 3-phosphate reductase
METRTLGQTGLKVSVLSFGCGAVGGLMVKGAAADQERAVARAMELGINYFDTAPMYGNGESERNLGRVLKALSRPKVYLGTKVWLDAASLQRPAGIGKFIADSMEASLQRLGLEAVDLFQLHNPISDAKRDGAIDPKVREQVLPAFARLRGQGKARFFGFTALGDTPAIQSVLDLFDTAQVSYNLLNPSAGTKMPADYPAQDYGNLIARAHANGVGTIGIRVLAGGALSGVETRHPLGMQSVDPIGSASSYVGDVTRAVRFGEIVKRGFAQSLVEASIRYVLSNPDLSTTLVGLSTLEQLDLAGQSAKKGPLPAEALKLISTIQQGFVGEVR